MSYRQAYLRPPRASTGGGSGASRLSAGRKIAAGLILAALAAVVVYETPYRRLVYCAVSLACTVASCGATSYLLFCRSAVMRRERLLAALFMMVATAFFAILFGSLSAKQLLD